MELERWRQWSSLAVCGAALAGLAGCGGGGGGTTLSAAGATGETSATSAASADAAAAAPDAAATAPAPSVASPSSTPGMVESAPVNSAATTPAPAATVRPAAPISLPATVAPVSASGGAPTLGDCEMFPSNAIFNTRIDDTSRFPVHPQERGMDQLWSAATCRSAPTGATAKTRAIRPLHYFGMPINVWMDRPPHDWPVVSFDFAPSGVFCDKGYPNKSDCAVPDGNGGYTIGRSCGIVTPAASGTSRFPRPTWSTRTALATTRTAAATIMCWWSKRAPAACGRACSRTTSRASGTRWPRRPGTCTRSRCRPNDWASGNAAGLPITPLLAKAAEANSGEIRHALSVAFRDATLAIEHGLAGTLCRRRRQPRRHPVRRPAAAAR